MAPEIVDAVAHHHDARTGGGLDPLATAVLLADYLASRLGRAIPIDPDRKDAPAGDQTHGETLREVGRRSGIDGETMRTLFEEAGAIIEMLG